MVDVLSQRDDGCQQDRRLARESKREPASCVGGCASGLALHVWDGDSVSGTVAECAAEHAEVWDRA